MNIFKLIKGKPKFILLLLLCISMLFSNVAFAATDDEVSESTSDTSTLATGQAVANYAVQFVGNPYVWGGESLTNGCDCSGFVMLVYAHFGISLPHSSESLGADDSLGVKVSEDQMQPGDVITFHGHCGIYIGNGQMVHASNSKPYPVGGIKISDVADVAASHSGGIRCVKRFVDTDTVALEGDEVTNLRDFLKDTVKECYENDLQKMLTRSVSGFYATEKNGDYETHMLDDGEAEQIAALCKYWQDSSDGIYEGASLIANRYELYAGDNDSVVGFMGKDDIDYIKDSDYDDLSAFLKHLLDNNKTSPSETDISTVEDVFNSGNRTLPSNVDQFDFLSVVEDSASEVDDDGDFISGVTQFTSSNNVDYTFYSLSSDENIVFGYTETDENVILPDTNPIDEESSGEVNIGYNYIFSDESYYSEYKDHNQFLQTTNSAEILAMAYTYYDLDVGFSNDSTEDRQTDLQKVKNYIIALYTASHEITLARDNETIDRHTGKLETVKTGTATCQYVVNSDSGAICGEVLDDYKVTSLRQHLIDKHNTGKLMLPFRVKQNFIIEEETVEEEVMETVLETNYDYIYNTYFFPDLFDIAQNMKSGSYSTRIVDESYQIGLDLDHISIPQNGSNNQVVYYSQGTDGNGWRPEWADLAYGVGTGKTISSSGCSITALAMVISYLNSGTDSSGWVTPGGVRQAIMDNNNNNYNQFMESGGATHNAQGDASDICSNVASYFGYNCACICDKAHYALASESEIDQIVKALQAGYPVIAVAHAGYFTTGGHFIVITGMTEDGRFTVNDPNGRHQNYSDTPLEKEYLFSATCNLNGFWVLY